MLTVLFEGVFPVFAVALAGFVFGYRQWFSWEAAHSINRYVLHFALPVLWFHLIATAPFDTFDWELAITYLVAEILVYLLGFLVARYWFKRNLKESALWGLATAYANQLFFVLPIVLHLFGSDAALPIIAISTLDVLVLMTGTMLFLEFIDGRSSGISMVHTAASAFKTPAMVGLSLGVFILLSGFALPKGLIFFSTFVGNSAAPVSLFSLGAVLALSGELRAAGLPIVISAIKLLAMPVLVWILFFPVANIKTEASLVALMLAAGPVGTTPFVLALQYKVPVGEISLTILLTTILSLGTVSLFAAYV